MDGTAARGDVQHIQRLGMGVAGRRVAEQQKAAAGVAAQGDVAGRCDPVGHAVVVGTYISIADKSIADAENSAPLDGDREIGFGDLPRRTADFQRGGPGGEVLAINGDRRSVGKVAAGAQNETPPALENRKDARDGPRDGGGAAVILRSGEGD